MNLNAIAAGAVSAVNPWVTAEYRQSTGATSSASGHRTPTYAAPVAIQVQMQALSYKDLIQVQGLNLNGETRAIYVNSDWRGVSRPDMRGGDLIALPDGRVWLVKHVLENWFDTGSWCKVAAVLQGAS